MKGRYTYKDVLKQIIKDHYEYVIEQQGTERKFYELMYDELCRYKKQMFQEKVKRNTEFIDQIKEAKRDKLRNSYFETVDERFFFDFSIRKIVMKEKFLEALDFIDK